MAVFWQKNNQKQLSEYIANLEDRVDDLTSKLASLTIELNAANEEASHLRAHAKSPQEFEEMQRSLDAKLEESQTVQAAISEKYVALLSQAQTETQRLMRENEALSTRLALSNSRIADLEASIQSIKASGELAFKHSLGQTTASMQLPDMGENTNSPAYQNPKKNRREIISEAYKKGLSLGSFVFDAAGNSNYPTAYDESFSFEAIVDEVLSQKRSADPVNFFAGVSSDELFGNEESEAAQTVANNEQNVFPKSQSNGHTDKYFAQNEIINPPVPSDAVDAIIKETPFPADQTGTLSSGFINEETPAENSQTGKSDALERSGKTLPEMKINTNIRLVDLFGKKRG